jgi:hypothetical protein
LRSHHALIERTVPRELKIFFLAIIGIGDGADGQDDFNQSVLHSKDCLSHIYVKFITAFQVSTGIAPCKQFCRIATSRRQNIEISMKSATLTLDVGVQCFKNT